MAKIFLEVKHSEVKANCFVNYLCLMIREHLEGKVVGITANEEWQDGSPAQIVFQLNISREEADKLVTELNEEDQDETYGSWFLADE